MDRGELNIEKTEATDLPVNHTECLHRLFETWVDKDPLSLALDGENIHLTYEELEVQANQLAHLLRAYGAGPGKLIGLYYYRGSAPIVSILACLKAGAGYVPIDPICVWSRRCKIFKTSIGTIYL